MRGQPSTLNSNLYQILDVALEDRDGSFRMMMAVIWSSLVGAILGLRFKVQVLFLAAPAAFAISAGIAGATRAVEPALLVGAATAVGLQIGYLGGLFTRFAMAASRTSPKPALRSITHIQG